MNFSNVLKKRTIIGLLCIGLSLIICFGLTPLFNKALMSQKEIVRVKKDIKKGEVFNADNVEKVTVGAFNLPSNIINKMEDLTGKYATTDLMRGDYILASKITDKPYEENEYLYKLDGKREAISISIKSFALGLSGKLKSGDIISIIASDYGDMRQTLTPPELQYVEVLAVTNAKGSDEGSIDKQQNSDGENQLPSTVTVLVSNAQAGVLADLEAKSKIHIALVYRGDKSSAKKFLEAQESAMKKLEPADNQPIKSSATNTNQPININ